MLSLLLNGIRNGNLDFGSVIAEILAVLVIIFLILPFHEWAHAFTASLLGDKAVKGRGRLSINPLSHIDPMGALCMLLFGFGWAKPVPIDPRNFKKSKGRYGNHRNYGSDCKYRCGFYRTSYLLSDYPFYRRISAFDNRRICCSIFELLYFVQCRTCSVQPYPDSAS